MKMEELNEQSKAALLESVIDNIADGIMVVDPDGMFLIINKAAQRITGVSEVEKNRDWSDVFGCFRTDGTTPYPAPELPLARAMRGESTDAEEIIIKNASIKNPVRISVSGRPLPLESRIPGGAVIIFRDVTEQRFTEQQLKISNDNLQQFAYIAAHDLQEPLRTTTSYLQLLEERCLDKLDEKGQKYLSSALRGGERMQILIADLLSYCRINTKKKRLSRVSLQKALEQALEMVESSILETGTTVLADPLPEVMGDFEQLTQLFQNLISNSIKYKSAAPPSIKLTVQQNGADWRFGFSDNGIGIESQYAERIFLIFQRLHGRNEYPGTGIGLAVCKSIVQRHAGEIWVTSTESKGCTFWFTIPMIADES